MAAPRSPSQHHQQGRLLGVVVQRTSWDSGSGMSALDSFRNITMSASCGRSPGTPGGSGTSPPPDKKEQPPEGYLSTLLDKDILRWSRGSPFRKSHRRRTLPEETAKESVCWGIQKAQRSPRASVGFSDSGCVFQGQSCKLDSLGELSGSWVSY